MESSPEIRGVHSQPEELRLYSSKHDILPVDPEQDQVYVFEDESLPPCLEIKHESPEVINVDYWFINDTEALKKLNDAGVSFFKLEKPYYSHLDNYTDPSNASGDLLWHVEVVPKGDLENEVSGGEFNITGRSDDWITLPKDETLSEIISHIEVEGELYPVTLENTRQVEIGSDESLDHLLVDVSGEENMQLCIFMENLDCEPLEEFIEQGKLKSLYLPTPPESIVNLYYQKRTGEYFDDEDELAILLDGGYEAEEDDDFDDPDEDD